VGALIARRRGYDRAPLTPLMYGGGQERGLRPGTLPVHLIAGLGLAAELAQRDARKRAETCRRLRERALAALMPLGALLQGDPMRTLPHVVNLSFPEIDSEALMLAWKGLLAVSNGSACTSHSYEPSHVLRAMGVAGNAIQGAVRLSWSHLTVEPNWAHVAETTHKLSPI
jgi:cysteine desulfurase